MRGTDIRKLLSTYISHILRKQFCWFLKLVSNLDMSRFAKKFGNGLSITVFFFKENKILQIPKHGSNVSHTYLYPLIKKIIAFFHAWVSVCRYIMFRIVWEISIFSALENHVFFGRLWACDRTEWKIKKLLILWESYSYFWHLVNKGRKYYSINTIKTGIMIITENWRHIPLIIGCFKNIF